jgi:uncharacterized phage protein gp47/JayE
MPFVDATGLQIKTIEEILDELSTQQKAEIDSTLNTAPDEPLGELNGIFAAQLREIWEVAQVAYNGFNPDAAEGFLLEKLSALTGTLREGATKSTVVPMTVDLDAATTLLAGTHFAHVVGLPDNRWTPIEDYTASVGGSQSVDFEAEFAGAVIANAGTITVIATAVTGWNSVTNPNDANVGKEIDTNAELRQRREEELRATGSATLDAIRADVLADEDVLQVSVFENTSSVVDANGLPPKSIEVVVFDGSPPTLSNNEIAQLIFDTKPAGIETYGLETGTATDSLGAFHTIKFSRPTELQIWIELFVSVNISSGYAGASALEAALVELNTTDLLQGRDVIAARLGEVAMSFDGIFDLYSPPQLGLSPSPVGTANIVIGPREIARLDTGRITINESIGPLP